MVFTQAPGEQPPPTHVHTCTLGVGPSKFPPQQLSHPQALPLRAGGPVVIPAEPQDWRARPTSLILCGSILPSSLPLPCDSPPIRRCTHQLPVRTGPGPLTAPSFPFCSIRGNILPYTRSGLCLPLTVTLFSLSEPRPALGSRALHSFHRTVRF